MSLLDHLNWRHAVKAFDPTKKVSQENINKIIEAARLAPTSSGLQPFRLLVIESQEIKDKLVDGAFNPDCMRECSHVLVFAGWNDYSDQKIDEMYDMTTDQRDLPQGRFSSYTDKIKEIYNNQSTHKNFEHIARQAYIAMGFALAQAAELRVDTCPAEGFSTDLVDEVLELDKQGLKSIVLMYVGVADPERDWMAPMAKVRNAAEEFVIKY
ncbi:NAD(P)H-dependent oxidoreductase [Psychrobacter sp. H7-1]|uniref:NAD(P)H-dependent oxidoreductase n=1 Tax=Psychrobacter sp. H7-1 TaxID=1569265 RepID=UPI00191B50BF|nr:NAD(P)H-dependent oxidoreductase [Psychrobacter sp. H7-1]